MNNAVSNLRGVGPASAQRLKVLNIQTMTDLIFYFPRSYDDFSTIMTVAEAPPDTPVTTQVTLTKIKTHGGWKRRRLTITEAVCQDQSGTIKVIWFNQSYIAEQLHPGEHIFLAGKITQDKYGRHFTNPIFERVKPDTTHTARIVPRYPLTKGLTQKQLRYYIKQGLTLVQQGQLALTDWLPQSVQEQYDLIDLTQAVTHIHFPENEAALAAARFRLGFDELLPMQLFVRLAKASLAQAYAIPLPFRQSDIQSLVKTLPFKLTQTQRKVGWEILQDLARATPMNRLLEGDVGAGKTVIAVLAMYQVVQSGYQAVLMAPTELLAAQHWQTLCKLLEKTNVSIGLVTSHQRETFYGEQSSAQSRDMDIIVGTHSVLETNVPLPRVALVVIDEQHRFGVQQRQRLKERAKLANNIPHLLSMTATPIPRSLALALYGDLDISILDELPPQRQRVQTQLITARQRASLYRKVRERIAAGEQVYIVAPKIRDEDMIESTEIASVEAALERWKNHVSGSRLAVLHGGLPPQVKRDVMTKFRHGLIDVLIATTVIEVGVDVSNATIMIIEKADCFGLAQLHQLRGRVGRSNKASYCYVCYDDTAPLALERLQFFTEHDSGFALAEYDLTTRGPGDVYGEEQSGYLTSLKIARLSDHHLLQIVTQAADALLPRLADYPTIQQRVQMFIKKVHLE